MLSKLQDYQLNQIQFSMQNENKIYWVYLLLNKVAEHLQKMIKSIEDDDIKLGHELSLKIHKIVEVGLLEHLDFEHGGSIAQNFKQFYLVSLQIILTSRLNKNTKDLKKIADSYSTLAQSWLLISKQ